MARARSERKSSLGREPSFAGLATRRLLLISCPEPRKERSLQYGLVPVFQRLLDLVQKLVGDGAVHNAMVIAERHVAHRADGNESLMTTGRLFDGAETQDANVGLADHWKAEQAAEKRPGW